MTEDSGQARNELKGAGKFKTLVLLPALLFLGAVLGFVYGGLAGRYWQEPSWAFPVGLTRLLGELFLDALKMAALPLIVCSVVSGTASLGRSGGLKGTALKTFGYYLVTTLTAVVIGLLLVNLIHPGSGVTPSGGAMDIAPEGPWYEQMFKVVRGLVPPNLFAAAAEGRILGLLVFSLLLGGLLGTMGEKGERAVQVFSAINDAMLRLVQGLVWLAPLGVLCLVADRVGKAGGGPAVLAEITGIGKYFGTVVIGLAVHGLFVLPALLWFVAKRNPLSYAGAFSEPLLTAFSTASSAAALPLTMECARNKAGISEDTSSFVLTLGATVNMDGTALYEAVAALFIAQAYGMELGLAGQIVVCLTATLAAVGAAAIPQAGLVTMVLVLQAAGIPVQGIATILSVDWLLDRFRTAVNVWGDSVGAAVVERMRTSAISG